MLKAKAGFRPTQMSAIRLSSATIAFLVGPLLPFAMMPLLKLSAIAYTRSWGHLPVFLGGLMSSMMALCFCAIVDRSIEDFKYSTFF